MLLALPGISHPRRPGLDNIHKPSLCFATLYWIAGRHFKAVEGFAEYDRIGDP